MPSASKREAAYAARSRMSLRSSIRVPSSSNAMLPLSSTSKTTSNSASLMRSLPISSGSFHVEQTWASALDALTWLASCVSDPGG
jgi:hypothetical protein